MGWCELSVCVRKRENGIDLKAGESETRIPVEMKVRLCWVVCTVLTLYFSSCLLNRVEGKKRVKRRKKEREREREKSTLVAAGAAKEEQKQFWWLCWWRVHEFRSGDWPCNRRRSSSLYYRSHTLANRSDLSTQLAIYFQMEPKAKMWPEAVQLLIHQCNLSRFFTWIILCRVNRATQILFHLVQFSFLIGYHIIREWKFHKILRGGKRGKKMKQKQITRIEISSNHSSYRHSGTIWIYYAILTFKTTFAYLL